MIKRKDIVSMLKSINIEQIESDGPTSVFYSFDGGKSTNTITLSVHNELITATIGKVLIKRKYSIHKRELI